MTEKATLAFDCKKFVLQTLMDKAQRGIPSKDILPVLKHFQVEAYDGKLKIIATDMDMAILCQTPMVNIRGEGTAILPGKSMLQICSEAAEGDMTIDVAEGECHIAVGRAVWDLRLADGDDYPAIPNVDDIEMHAIDRGEFYDGIKYVRHAACVESVRPQLMMIDISMGKMRASDGIRFQQVTTNVPIDLQIPITAVDDLMALLRTTEAPKIQVGEDDNHIVFKIGSDTFMVGKINALFPDVENHLLKPALKNDAELHIDREDLQRAIRRIRVTADQTTSAILLELDANTCTVRSRDAMGNQSHETIECSWKHEPRSVAFNHQYLMDMLQMIDSKSCHFFLGPDSKTKKSPILLKDESAGITGLLSQARVDLLTTGDSSGESDFRTRQGGGDYATGKGIKDERENIALAISEGVDPEDRSDEDDFDEEDTLVGADVED